jgi:predicted nucleotide-binding protein
MIERFQDRDVLLEALRSQKLLLGNEELVKAVADDPGLMQLIEMKEGSVLIEQGGDDNDLYLILAGSVDVLVNGRKVAERHPGDSVGEMAATLPHMRRSATVRLSSAGVLGKVTAASLSSLGSRYCSVWRQVAKVVTERLYQRNSFVSTSNDKLRVFIACSVEALPIAQSIQEAFKYDPFVVTIWPNGVFRASRYPVQSLTSVLDNSDFAVAIVQPDDMTSQRGQDRPVPRDNVLFELGMFIGRLGQHRSFMLEPSDQDVSLPSDLAGITTIPYRHGSESDRLALLGPACNELRRAFSELGAA